METCTVLAVHPPLPDLYGPDPASELLGRVRVTLLYQGQNVVELVRVGILATSVVAQYVSEVRLALVCRLKGLVPHSLRPRHGVRFG